MPGDYTLGMNMKNRFFAFAIVLMQLHLLAFSNEASVLSVKNPSTEVVQLMENIDRVRKLCFGWCSKAKAEAMASLIINTKPKICVEVGALAGSSFYAIPLTLNYLNSGRAFAVDSWNNADCLRYMPENDANREYWGWINLEDLRIKFNKLLLAEKLDARTTVYFEDSVAAARHFADNSIDFLHWDGNHSYMGAQREITAYFPKVKSGGYIWVNDVTWNVGGRDIIYEAMQELFETCELVDTLERDNVCIFRKL